MTTSFNPKTLQVGDAVLVSQNGGEPLYGEVTKRDDRWGGTLYVGVGDHHVPFTLAGKGRGRFSNCVLVGLYVASATKAAAEEVAQEAAKKEAETKRIADSKAAYEARQAKVAELETRLPFEETLREALHNFARVAGHSLDASRVRIHGGAPRLRVSIMRDECEDVQIRARLDRPSNGQPAWIVSLEAPRCDGLSSAQVEEQRQLMSALTAFVEWLKALLTEDDSVVDAAQVVAPMQEDAEAIAPATEERPTQDELHAAVLIAAEKSGVEGILEGDLRDQLGVPAGQVERLAEAIRFCRDCGALTWEDSLIKSVPTTWPPVFGVKILAAMKRLFCPSTLAEILAEAYPPSGMTVTPAIADGFQKLLEAGKVERWRVDERGLSVYRLAQAPEEQITLRVNKPALQVVANALEKRREIRAPKAEMRSSAAIVELPQSILGVSLEDEPSNPAEQDAWLDKKLQQAAEAQKRLPAIVAHLEAEEYSADCWACWREHSREHTSVYGDTLAEAVENLLHAEKIELAEGTCASILVFRWEGSFRQRENTFWTAQGEFDPLSPLPSLVAAPDLQEEPATALLAPVEAESKQPIRRVVSRCLCCGRPLRDAASLRDGVGPDCYKQYVGGKRDEEGRSEANKALYAAAVAAEFGPLCELSSRLQELRALGYERVADIAEDRLAKVRIEQAEDCFLVVSPFDEEAIESWRAFSQWDREAKARRVPLKAKQVLWQHLRRFHAGCVAKGPKGLFQI